MGNGESGAGGRRLPQKLLDATVKAFGPLAIFKLRKEDQKRVAKKQRRQKRRTLISGGVDPWVTKFPTFRDWSQLTFCFVDEQNAQLLINRSKPHGVAFDEFPAVFLDQRGERTLPSRQWVALWKLANDPHAYEATGKRGLLPKVLQRAGEGLCLFFGLRARPFYRNGTHWRPQFRLQLRLTDRMSTSIERKPKRPGGANGN